MGDVRGWDHGSKSGLDLTVSVKSGKDFFLKSPSGKFGQMV